MIKRYIGDAGIYRRFFRVALPMIIQNGITNFVSLLDNVMVGAVGTLPMSGVSIVNGLLFVFNLCVFGASSGAGIFTAQFFGSGDHRGVRYTFRFKILACMAVALAGIGIFLGFGDGLIGLYLQGEGDASDAAAVLAYGLRYLRIMAVGLIPFALSNAYAGTLRETGETKVPMLAGIAAVFVNLGLNYVLIFGKLGAPAMGAEGAAWATVISRYVELVIMVAWTHLNPEKNPFIVGVYRSFSIPGKLFWDIVRKGMPLLINEFLWASGMAVMNQCYSTCGLEVVPAQNISGTMFNLASVAFLALGNAVGIIMGQMLGANHTEQEIRDANRQLVVVSVLSGVVFGALMASVSGVFPLLYKTTDAVRLLATRMILVSAVMMPFNSFTNASYFTLRSGGQTMVTFLFDSCYMWAVCVPLAFLFSRVVVVGIIPLYMICQGTDLLKCVLGAVMIKQGKWIRNLTQ
jgi:putative MATE family efflux protein